MIHRKPIENLNEMHFNELTLIRFLIYASRREQETHPPARASCSEQELTTFSSFFLEQLNATPLPLVY